ncbi:uncharacterized protein (DUF736 family) [Sphingomonas sp. SORGH_AS 950]|uniref:DUF736 domain-containing protein n=1 Tax=Sphingomonas sp. SORGH_AS_0950 TaxID=3041792 RepID=UPI00278B4468|nr:DUF736 family protein [Sphingomonas sp. SORGH_AS_0950]MDQ1158953.1 uncharacterized protein (DUF736 family) [Sphingomonas sp. SORGH_AS_0950]
MSIVIGRFKLSRQGGWEGEIQTLTISRKVRLVPNDDRTSERAPAFRVLLGGQRIGDAWEERSRGETPRDYVRVILDDPLFQHPRKAALFPDVEGSTASLIWDRSYL